MEIMRIKLKELRLGRGLTQGQVAKLLKCTTGTYAKMENESVDITYEKLSILASIYGLKLFELFQSMETHSRDPKSLVQIQEEQIYVLQQEVMDIQNKAIQLHQELRSR